MFSHHQPNSFSTKYITRNNISAKLALRKDGFRNGTLQPKLTPFKSVPERTIKNLLPDYLISIHPRNMQTLMPEMYRMAPVIAKNLLYF